MPKHSRPTVKSVSVGVLITGLVVSGLLLTKPDGPLWGTFYAPHDDEPTLRLSETVTYEQSFAPEFSHIDGLLIFIDTPFPDTGNIIFEVQQDTKTRHATIPLNQVPATGEIYASFPRLTVNQKSPAVARVSVDGAPRALGLRFQIDEHIYEAGTLTQVSLNGERATKAGDLAFRVHYGSSALERMHVSVPQTAVFLLLVLGAWYGVSQSVSRPQGTPPLMWQKHDWWAIAGVSLFLGGFFLYHFLSVPLSFPSAQGDEVKNILYLNSTIKALKAGTLPYWHHTTCGGQPLMGNPEANTGGMGPLLGLFWGPAGGEKLLISLESVALGVGLFVLARYFGVSTVPALLPALIVPLCGYVVNRILIGHSHYAGGLAFTPWILLTYLLSTRSHWWSVVTGVLLAATIYRGDTHPLFYTIILLAVWGITLVISRRTWRPIVVGLQIAMFFIVFSAGKVLPILESTQHFNSDALPPMVVLLTQQKMWDDVFLDKSIHTAYLEAEVIGSKWEDWENIGVYTGLIPLLLGLFGIFVVPKQTRLLLGVGLVVFLILGEGTLYHVALRHIPYIGSLLRMPSRTLIIFIVLLALAGAFTLERLWRQRTKHRPGPVVALALLVWVVLSVGSYAHQTLSRMEFAPAQAFTRDDVPLTLQAHPYKDGLHALTIASRNSVAPGTCQDFNVAAPFDTTPNTPLITDSEGQPLPATLEPNTIRIPPPQNSKITIRAVDSNILHVTNGYTLPMTENGLPIIVADPTQPVVLTYNSPTTLAGLILAFAFALSLFLLWRQHKGNLTHPQNRIG